MRSITAVVRVTLVVALLLGVGTDQVSAQDRGIDWVNLEIGIDHNGDSTSRGAPKYFAQIHLLIPLSREQRDSVDAFAAARDIDRLKDSLKAWLRGDAANDANRAIIDALAFRPETADAGPYRGIDWVNLGTGTDYNGDATWERADRAPMFFAEIHLLIPLANAGLKNRIDQAAAARRDSVVRSLLRDALSGPAKNPVNEGLIDSMQLKPPRTR